MRYYIHWDYYYCTNSVKSARLTWAGHSFRTDRSISQTHPWQLHPRMDDERFVKSSYAFACNYFVVVERVAVADRPFAAVVVAVMHNLVVVM